jgi:hypothetical protein
MLVSQRRPLTSMFSGFSRPTPTPVLDRTAVVERITSRADVGHGQVDQRVVSGPGWAWVALPDLTSQNRVRE